MKNGFYMYQVEKKLAHFFSQLHLHASTATLDTFLNIKENDTIVLSCVGIFGSHNRIVYPTVLASYDVLKRQGNKTF